MIAAIYARKRTPRAAPMIEGSFDSIDAENLRRLQQQRKMREE